jgi:hypothetical protein
VANVFETELAKSFRQPEPNLPAPLTCRYEYTKLVVNKQRSYGVETPCDALVDGLDGVYLALELKEQQKREGFKLSRVPEHQIQGLLRYQALGRKSFLVVCFRTWVLRPKEKLGKAPGELQRLQRRRAFALPIDLFIEWKETLTSQQRASIPADVLAQIGIELPALSLPAPTEANPKGKASGWDIRPFFSPATKPITPTEETVSHDC